MKSVKKIYPSSTYPYYFLNKIVIPNEPCKKEVKLLTDFENNLLLDLLFPVSPSKEIN